MGGKKRDNRIFNRDNIKCLAIIVMFAGHLVAWLNLLRHPEENGNALYLLPLWQQILATAAVFCPPVMFFMIADGYKYTHDRKKYAVRLLIFACITQVFEWLLFYPLNGWRSFNVIFTLLFGLLGIMIWESGRKLWQRIAAIVLLDALTLLLFTEWMIFGILFILALHIFREKPKTRAAVYAVLTLLHSSTDLFALSTHPAKNVLTVFAVHLLSMSAAYLCMTVLYNGRKGKYPQLAKWFFYGFYPLHYIVILLIWKVQS